jgi:hypothetical protein
MLGLWEKLTPKVQGKIFVCPTKDTYEMSLEGLDGFLGNVSLMVMWWD